MTKDQKLVSLTRYAQTLRQRLSAPTPEKHQHRVKVYKDFLELDLKKTLRKIETLA